MRIGILAFGFGVLGSACTGSLDPSGGGPGPGPGPVGQGVQVVVTDGRAPQAGVRVIFEDATDAVAADVMTDATGAATANLPDGGSVSVIRTFTPIPGNPPLPDQVTTFVGAKPGDRLRLAGSATDAVPNGAINVLVPSLANGGVTVMASCGTGSGNPPAVAMSVTNCDAQLGFYAVDDAKEAFFMRAPYAPSVDLSSAVFKGALSSSITATDLPPNENVSAELRLGADGYYFYKTDPQQVDQGTQNVDLPQVSGVDQLAITSVSGNNRTQMVATRSVFQAGTPITIDASAGLIGTISDPTFAPGSITWTEETPGAPDFVIASLDVTRSQLGTEYTRTVIAPYVGPVLRVPALAASLAYDPTTDDQVATALAAVKVTGGYDALRGAAFAGASLLEATPAGAQLTVSYGGGALPGL